ncbi:MAG: branched-chain amino acid ABC transporter permease [Gammaproteobacteria bacterium]|nr:branched-chain amino acid ABC transporter permease [Gammaproteobacteria bacterium]MCP4880345.1 branched-chain amino acid ABC transporter permease [Gammaproteobacteria bacterium]
MTYLLGIFQTIGVHTLLGLSAYLLLLTGQLSLAQVGFFAIGAYVSGILTVIFTWNIFPALAIGAFTAGFFAFLVGFPALRVKGLMLVVATISFSEIVRLFFFNLSWRVNVNGLEVGPDSTQGFREIRYFAANGWEQIHIVGLIWFMVIVVMLALWWLDQVRAGAVLRAVGTDELAAQSSGINLTMVKVAAMTGGGVIAGIGGGLFAHSTTYVDHHTFVILLATFAVSYPIIGGLRSVMGTLLAVIFIQGVIVEGLRFMGDYRNLIFGLLIILVMNLRPQGLLDGHLLEDLKKLLGRLTKGEKADA